MADHKSNKQGESHQGGPNVASQPKGTGEDNDTQRDEQEDKRLRDEAQNAPHTHPNRDEATQERLDAEAEDAPMLHHNRGHNKADNGKGSYA